MKPSGLPTTPPPPPLLTPPVPISALRAASLASASLLLLMSMAKRLSPLVAPRGYSKCAIQHTEQRSM